MEVERLELDGGDYPRTSGVQLIVALLDRGREGAAKTLVDLAGRVQVSGRVAGRRGVWGQRAPHGANSSCSAVNE